MRRCLALQGGVRAAQQAQPRAGDSRPRRPVGGAWIWQPQRRGRGTHVQGACRGARGVQCVAAAPLCAACPAAAVGGCALRTLRLARLQMLEQT